MGPRNTKAIKRLEETEDEIKDTKAQIDATIDATIDGSRLANELRCLPGDGPLMPPRFDGNTLWKAQIDEMAFAMNDTDRMRKLRKELKAMKAELKAMKAELKAMKADNLDASLTDEEHTRLVGLTRDAEDELQRLEDERPTDP